MKKITWIIFFTLLFQMCSQALWAAHDAPLVLLSEPIQTPWVKEFAANEVTNSESAPAAPEKPTKDEEFSSRSRSASRFIFIDLPRHLAYDIKESFWGWGSLGLGIGIAMTAGLYQEDNKIQTFTPYALFGNTTDDVLNVMGAPYSMLGVGFFTAVFGAGFHNKKLLTTGEALLESLFWTELFTLGLKYAIDRTRPDGSGQGFPSAHASGAFSTATVFQMMYGIKVGIPLYAFAAAVSISRVDSYAHFASDVLGGAVLGSFIAYGTTKFHKELHHSFQVQPMMGKNQYGLLVHHAF